MWDLLSTLYPWTKSFHILSIVAWMAGLFYLPRLFVYHVEQVKAGGQTDALFQTMELKLLKFIMNPAMIASWVFGLMLVMTPGIVDWGTIWPWTKAAAALAMTWFHHWLGLRRKGFQRGDNRVNGRQYRMMNELPTLLLVVIVFSVVLKF